MILIVMTIVGVICAAAAHHKGRSVVGWFFIGFFFGLIGLILILVMPNLKAAREKELHMEMEQRRLREQLRQEQIKSEQFRKYAQVRLDVHDKELKIDTRQTWKLPGRTENQPILDNPAGSVEQEAVINADEQKIILITQCPHCLSTFKMPKEHINKKAICPKCKNLFIMIQFVTQVSDEKCSSCQRTISKNEPADLIDGKTVCKECKDKLQTASGVLQEKNEGWYYQQQDVTSGPVSLDVLKRLLEEEKIDAMTYVWHKSLKSWIPAGDIVGPGGESGNG